MSSSPEACVVTTSNAAHDVLKSSPAGIRTPVTAVKAPDDNPYTTGEVRDSADSGCRCLHQISARYKRKRVLLLHESRLLETAKHVVIEVIRCGPAGTLAESGSPGFARSDNFRERADKGVVVWACTIEIIVQSVPNQFVWTAFIGNNEIKR